MTKAATKLIYVKQLFEFLEVQIELPLIIQVDNQAAIFLARNEISSRTKHVDVRYHFIQELVETGVIKLEYVHTKENIADVLTKNLPS